MHGSRWAGQGSGEGRKTAGTWRDRREVTRQLALSPSSTQFQVRLCCSPSLRHGITTSSTRVAEAVTEVRLHWSVTPADSTGKVGAFSFSNAGSAAHKGPRLALGLGASRQPAHLFSSPLASLCFSLKATRSARGKPSWAVMKLTECRGSRPPRHSAPPVVPHLLTARPPLRHMYAFIRLVLGVDSIDVAGPLQKARHRGRPCVNLPQAN